jgi:hypothetical protein
MFDSVYVCDLTCSACGRTTLSEVEVQFQLFVGRVYEPELRSVRIDERIPGMPMIPVLDAGGYWRCRLDGTCYHLNDVRVRFEQGVVAWARPFERDAEEYPTPPMVRLPSARNAKKRRRFVATVEERRRRLAELVASGTEHSAGALMSRPLRRRLDYQSIGRQLFRVELMGTENVGPYQKEPGGRWRRVSAGV